MDTLAANQCNGMLPIFLILKVQDKLGGCRTEILECSALDPNDLCLSLFARMLRTKASTLKDGVQVLVCLSRDFSEVRFCLQSHEL